MSKEKLEKYLSSLKDGRMVKKTWKKLSLKLTLFMGKRVHFLKHRDEDKLNHAKQTWSQSRTQRQYDQIMIILAECLSFLAKNGVDEKVLEDVMGDKWETVKDLVTALSKKDQNDRIRTKLEAIKSLVSVLKVYIDALVLKRRFKKEMLGCYPGQHLHFDDMKYPYMTITENTLTGPFGSIKSVDAPFENDDLKVIINSMKVTITQHDQILKTIPESAVDQPEKKWKKHFIPLNKEYVIYDLRKSGISFGEVEEIMTKEGDYKPHSTVTLRKADRKVCFEMESIECNSTINCFHTLIFYVDQMIDDCLAFN